MSLKNYKLDQLFRKDLKVMNSHSEIIKDKDLNKIYKLISNSIIRSHHGNN